MPVAGSSGSKSRDSGAGGGGTGSGNAGSGSGGNRTGGQNFAGGSGRQGATGTTKAQVNRGMTGISSTPSGTRSPSGSRGGDDRVATPAQIKKLTVAEIRRLVPIRVDVIRMRPRGPVPSTIYSRRFAHQGAMPARATPPGYSPRNFGISGAPIGYRTSSGRVSPSQSYDFHGGGGHTTINRMRP